MSKCTSEFDITVMNRIRPIRAALLPTKSMHHLDEVENGSPCCNKVFLSLECVQWTPLVRFPKVGPIESFHSSRQLHDEFLQVEIQNLNIKTCITEFNFLEMSFASARANLMVEEEVHRMISIKSEGLSDSLRVSIKFNLRSRVTHNLCSAYSDNQETNFSELNVDGGAPFSLKKRMFKGRDLVLPAKRQEMKSNLVEEFSDSKVKVIVCLHQVVFYFPSKTVLDLLQNRLLMDALLWEVGTPDHIRFDSKHSIDSVGYESSKPDVVDNADDLCMPEKIWQRNALCVSIMIKEGRISLGMPETHNSRIFALAVSSLHFACVNHRHEDQESWSFSAQSENLEFSIESQESGKMFTKILQTSKDCFGLEDVKSAKDALSVAVLVNDNGMNRMQHNKVAVTLRNCILYHLETPANEKMWMSQLTDILSAIGAGNDSKTVSSSSSSRINSTFELHFSLKNCAVEYKPPSMAHRVILVTKSSHITNRNDLEPGGYEFSIYVEESGLFLGSKLPRLKKIDLRKDVVCVADINSVDFNLRQLNKFDEKCPQTKLSASINRFNLWTCSDSFAVLSQMIIHLANSKTLSPSPEQTLNEENGKVAIDSVVMEMMVENEDILTELLDDAMKYNFMPPSKYVIQKRKRNDSSTLDEKPIINVIADCPVEFENDSFVDLGSTCHMSSFQIPAQIPKVNLKFVENHFKDNSSQAQESNRQSVPVEKYHLHDTTITWYMFGGKDLTRTSKDPQMNHRKVDSRHRQKGISWREFCGQERDQSVLMEFHVKRIQAIHEVYPKGCEDHSRDVLLIKEVEVLDRLEVSGINKFLHPCFHSTANDNNMVKICVRHVRDDTNSLKRECELKISLMPVKLNIDQDSITFVCDFINEVTERVLIPPESSDQNKLKKFVELGMTGPSGGSVKELHQIYFRSIKFSPEVIIKIDYRGKMADRGSVKGLLASILHLDQSEIVLKRIIYRNGIRGVEKLMSLMMDEWVKDIKKNQISNMIKGIGPAGTIFNIARGVKDLLFMPVEQYRKDGRVVMGLQKGVSSFASCTLASSLELVYRSFNALQCLTQFAHDVVAMGGDDGLDGAKTSQKMKTPEDLREGFMGAYAIVKEGLNARAFEMRDALSPKNHRKGVAKTLGGILKQVPQTVIDPILVATKATTNFLEGARNQMLPEVKKEQMEKWKAR